MRMRASYVAAALSLAFAASASATIVGSTYNFTTSVTGNTQISPFGGPTSHTDPANPGFCVGPPVACGFGEGLSGSISFLQATPTLDLITFAFFGSTFGAGPGSFTINLGNFVTLDGETITGVSLAGGGLLGSVTSVTFDGTDAAFTWTTGSDYNGIGGNFVVFNVVTTTGPAPQVPEPASLALLSLGLAGLGFARRNQC